jgi:rhodanese-related sulfurtransferase
MEKNQSVFGIYPSRDNVETAVTALKHAGFANSDVSILLPENITSEDFATEQSTKAPEGAAVGAGSGACIGGALGWLVGVGALAIPGIGPVIAAGPLVAALAGIGIGGALGGFAGSLVGMGIPEADAKKFEGELLKGGILVVVHCEAEDESQRAQHALRASGAQDIAVPSGTLSETRSAA